MLFGYFTLFVALIIETVGAYYSVTGLAAIFSGAVIPILIMGGSLEVGKVTAAVWLKLNWERASLAYKLYLVPAVAFLMVLTSMGIFGYLSKAHSDQSLVSGDSMAQVAIYDEKIKTAKDNIDTNRRALKQMDEAVDQVMARSDDEKGADKAVAIRRSQQKERARLLQEIATEQKTIAQLNEEAAPLRAEFRKVEADVGPIKYIAALIYGDNPDANILERAVRWVIILIVAVFDPLALVLILAAQQSLRWAQEDKLEDENHQLVYVADVGDKPTAEELTAIQEVDQPVETPSKDPHPPGWMYNDPGEHPKDTYGYETEAEEEKERDVFEQHPYLLKPFVHFKDLKPMPARIDDDKEEVDQLIQSTIVPPGAVEPAIEPEVSTQQPEPVLITRIAYPESNVENQVQEQTKIIAMGIDRWERPGDYITPEPDPEPVSKFPKVPATAKRYKEPAPIVPETLNVNKVGLQADNVEGTSANSDFGTKFPDNANKGDMFLRVDHSPNKLFKYNGTKWIEVDKSKTDSYAYDEQYILFLIEKLKSGEYELDQLSTSEQELVAEKLEQLKNDNT